MEYKFEGISLLDTVKTLCAYRGTSLRKLLKRMSEKHSFSDCYPSFYNKLKNNTLKYSEMQKIAKELEYEVIFKDLH